MIFSITRRNQYERIMTVKPTIKVPYFVEDGEYAKYNFVFGPFALDEVLRPDVVRDIYNRWLRLNGVDANDDVPTVAEWCRSVSELPEYQIWVKRIRFGNADWQVMIEARDHDKKAPNAYIIFKTEMSDQIRTELLDKNPNWIGRDLQIAINNRATEMWMNADEETKAEYKKKSCDRQAEIDERILTQMTISVANLVPETFSLVFSYKQTNCQYIADIHHHFTKCSDDELPKCSEDELRPYTTVSFSLPKWETLYPSHVAYEEKEQVELGEPQPEDVRVEVAMGDDLVIRTVITKLGDGTTRRHSYFMEMSELDEVASDEDQADNNQDFVDDIDSWRILGDTPRSFQITNTNRHSAWFQCAPKPIPVGILLHPCPLHYSPADGCYYVKRNSRLGSLLASSHTNAGYRHRFEAEVDDGY